MGLTLFDIQIASGAPGARREDQRSCSKLPRFKRGPQDGG